MEHAVNGESQEHSAALNLTTNAAALLGRSAAFQRLEPVTQAALLRDLGAIGRALQPEARRVDPYALTLETPEDFMQRRNQARAGRGGATPGTGPAPAADSSAPAPSGPRVAATESLARRAGALSDEINFPAFVAGLVHGTFDAIVDATIRQMEAFADLVSAVAKDVDQFTSQNITPNQTRDWLAQQYPQDLMLDMSGAQPRLRPRGPAAGEEAPSPAWLADFGLEGQPLSDELIEEQLVPAARRTVGGNRQQMLATMVLLGMSRITVKDGTIAAKVRFRATATDKADVSYATSQDPGGPTWGDRGSVTQEQHTMLVSTVGVNVQSDTDLKAELFGEVRINFVSETLPLERFADSARITLLQRNARVAAPQPGATDERPQPAALPPPAAPAPPPATAPPPAPVTGGGS
jgi:hypothetical protein